MNTLRIVSRAKLKDSLSQLYLEDPRPWLVGFGGGKDSTMLAGLIFDAVLENSEP
jgi:DNA sulfur modification protein DndC